MLVSGRVHVARVQRSVSCFPAGQCRVSVMNSPRMLVNPKWPLAHARVCVSGRACVRLNLRKSM